ncbi:MAG TPA: MFS transporter [Acidimicrobiia bacterium]|nr:MFS transporter [Acidimicrobiia bacterium]
MTTITHDTRVVLGAQALRAFGYGLTSVLLGVTLDELDFSGLEAGLVLAAVVAGTAVASIMIARYGDRVGRRRAYIALYVVLAVTGVVFAFATSAWVLGVVALAGALSTEVVESGPFTSLEQAMLAQELPPARLASGFGIYNAVATAGGAVGALAAALPSMTHRWIDVPTQRWFLLLVVAALAGVLLAVRLTPVVETERSVLAPVVRLERSRPTVVRLSGLFALDAFGGGFVVQSFIAFWFSRRFGATPGQIGLVFFTVSLLQTASFLLAPVLARRFGLLTTMVATHLPSNLFLIGLAFATNLPVAVALWFARVMIAQIDVPTRQAYVMHIVDPHERVPAAAYTNTARYVVRPAGPALAGAASSLALGAPFVIAGTVKAFYDIVLWRWFRHVPLPDTQVEAR